MADSRFQIWWCSPETKQNWKCGYQDTVELERQARLNKNFSSSAAPAVSVPLYGCQLCLHFYCQLFSSLPNLHLLCQHFQL